MALSMAASATDDNATRLNGYVPTKTEESSAVTDSNGSENTIEEVLTGDIMPVVPLEEIAEENSTSSIDNNVSKSEDIPCRTTGKIRMPKK